MNERLRSRKLLVASIGVATVTYVAVACGGATVTGPGSSDGGPDASKSHDTGGPVDGTVKDTLDEFPVANLVAPPDSFVPPDSSFIDTVDESPVANLVAPPDSSFFDTIDEFPVANLVAPPLDAGQNPDAPLGGGGH